MYCLWCNLNYLMSNGIVEVVAAVRVIWFVVVIVFICCYWQPAFCFWMYTCTSFHYLSELQLFVECCKKWQNSAVCPPCLKYKNRIFENLEWIFKLLNNHLFYYLFRAKTPEDSMFWNSWFNLVTRPKIAKPDFVDITLDFWARNRTLPVTREYYCGGWAKGGAM